MNVYSPPLVPIEVETHRIYSSNDLRRPRDLLRIDSLLLVLSPYSPHPVRVIRAADGVEAGFLPAPSGTSFTNTVWRHDDTVWIGDQGDRRIHAIPISTLVEAEGPLQAARSLDVPFPFAQALGHVAGGILVTHSDGGGHASVVSPTGVVLNETLPNQDLPRDLPQFGIRPFVQYSAAIGSGRWVGADMWAGMIAAYSFGERPVTRFETPLSEPRSYAINMRAPSPTVVPGPDAVVGYVDVVSDAPFVLALYSGAPHIPFGTRAFSARDIHVFSEKGTLCGVFRLDRPVASLGETELSGEFVASGDASDPAVVMFSLSKHQIAQAGPCESS